MLHDKCDIRVANCCELIWADMLTPYRSGIILEIQSPQDTVRHKLHASLHLPPLYDVLCLLILFLYIKVIVIRNSRASR